MANGKHPNYRDQTMEVKDAFVPEFKRDSRGRYFMQLPGYGKWMVGNEPGSKIISQGSENERGGPATSPESIQTGSLSAETVISVGDSIYLDGVNGCIHIGDYLKRTGASISICGNGMFGFSGANTVFAFFLENDGDFGRGDVFIGDYASDEYLLWDDSEGTLYVKGDIVVQGDIVSANYVAGVSGYKLTYATGDAEFNNITARGQINMQAGSTGDADYIAESAGRKWAAESGADITGNHTSNDTSFVFGDPASAVASGAERGLNAINASYRYQTWLTSNDMASSGISSGPAVIMDSSGIYGYSATQNTFHINSATGDALFRGTIYASAGLISGWIIDTDRLWKQIFSGGNYTKLEFNTREAAGIDMHIQAFTDNNSGYTSPTGVQITPGTSSSPNPRLDIYVNGTSRLTLDQNGLNFRNLAGTVIGTMYGSSSGYMKIETTTIDIRKKSPLGAEVVTIGRDRYSGSIWGFIAEPGFGLMCRRASTSTNFFRIFHDPGSGDDVIDTSYDNKLKFQDNEGYAIMRIYGRARTSPNTTRGLIDAFAPIRLLQYFGGIPGMSGSSHRGTMYYNTQWNEVWVWRYNTTTFTYEWKALAWAP